MHPAHDYLCAGVKIKYWAHLCDNFLKYLKQLHLLNGIKTSLDVNFHEIQLRSGTKSLFVIAETIWERPTSVLQTLAVIVLWKLLISDKFDLSWRQKLQVALVAFPSIVFSAMFSLCIRWQCLLFRNWESEKQLVKSDWWTGVLDCKVPVFSFRISNSPTDKAESKFTGIVTFLLLKFTMGRTPLSLGIRRTNEKPSFRCRSISSASAYGTKNRYYSEQVCKIIIWVGTSDTFLNVSDVKRLIKGAHRVSQSSWRKYMT